MSSFKEYQSLILLSMNPFYSWKLISNLQYMFKPSDNNGMLYLGGVPKEIDFNRKKGKCKVISNHWGCILHKKNKRGL